MDIWIEAAMYEIHMTDCRECKFVCLERNNTALSCRIDECEIPGHATLGYCDHFEAREDGRKLVRMWEFRSKVMTVDEKAIESETEEGQAGDISAVSV